MSGRTVYLNGMLLPQEEATVSILDRGFMLGDGVYELIPVFHRKPFRLDEHLRRMQHSLDGIRLANPMQDSAWRQVITQVVELHESDNQSVYLQVTRGAAPRDHAFPRDTSPTVLVMSNPLSYPDPAQIEKGICAISSPDLRWGRCDLKTIGLLPNVLARQKAVEAGCVECILFRDGILTEGAASNIFVVRNGVLLAPVKDHRMLPGITYDLVLELARANDIRTEVRDIAEGEVRSADEVWLTSSSREVQAIVELDGLPVGTGAPGALYRRMYALYQNFKQTLTGLS
ncbi:MAG: D-amino acid aminotransferase [Hydrogenophilaceae bacterium]|nr:D-amino acid aminotransferase [Hydrogenophilaceae bacterium]